MNMEDRKLGLETGQEVSRHKGVEGDERATPNDKPGERKQMGEKGEKRKGGREG